HADPDLMADQRLELPDEVGRRLDVAGAHAIPEVTEPGHVRHQSLASSRPAGCLGPGRIRGYPPAREKATRKRENSCPVHPARGDSWMTGDEDRQRNRDLLTS